MNAGWVISTVYAVLYSFVLLICLLATFWRLYFCGVVVLEITKNCVSGIISYREETRSFFVVLPSRQNMKQRN